jgi:zinc transport system ATP-binding protein
MKKLVSFDQVALGYQRKTVLHSISFDIQTGDLLGIVGANGAGKSTLLKAILGVVSAQKGVIRYAGEKKPAFGYVPQKGALNEYYPFSVAEIVMMGRYRKIGLLHRPKQTDRDQVKTVLEHLAIEHLTDSRFSDLSGGLQQRTLIARALIGEPDLLALDEPTEGLDPASEAAILQLVRHLNQEHNLTVIMVSHRLDQVMELCPRIGLIHQSGLELVDRKELLHSDLLSRIYGVPITIPHLEDKNV